MATSTDRSGRETGDVSQLPPPPPGAPRDTSDAAPTRRTTSSGVASSGGDATDGGWDWDRARDLAEAWYRPVTKPEGWWALGYLFFSALVSPFLFGAMVVVAAITFGLSFIGVGLLLIVPFFLMVEAFAGVEVYFAGLAGHEIEPRPTKPRRGFISSIFSMISDPVRWRHVAFVAFNVVTAWVLFAFGSLPASFVLQVIGGPAVLEIPVVGAQVEISFFPIALVVAVVAVGAIPRVSIWFAALKARISNWFIGTDRLAVAEQRVSDLSTQRRDILDAVASERRRIERNLHDGVQQQLVAIGLDLGMAEQQMDRDPERARELIGSARSKVQGSIGELRQLGRGLHPAILEDRGLDAALSAIVSGAAIPVSVHVDPDLDLSTDVAETIYFIANEAVANVLKHADAKVASVHVTRVAANVRITVHDDGVGGVDPNRGTGVAGIRARVNAVDGSITITSPAGGPTTFVAEIPRAAGGRP